MRHARGYRRLNRTHEHRKALWANMAGSLIEHEQIKTTLPKAKELRPYVEKLVTLAKKGGLSNRRLAHARLQDDTQLVKLFDVIAARYATRQGGYLGFTGTVLKTLNPMLVAGALVGGLAVHGTRQAGRRRTRRCSTTTCDLCADAPLNPDEDDTHDINGLS